MGGPSGIGPTGGITPPPPLDLNLFKFLQAASAAAGKVHEYMFTSSGEQGAWTGAQNAITTASGFISNLSKSDQSQAQAAMSDLKAALGNTWTSSPDAMAFNNAVKILQSLAPQILPPDF